jgi:hypothetical protein
MIRNGGWSVESDTVAESTLLQQGESASSGPTAVVALVADLRILGLRREVSAVDRVRRHRQERLRNLSQHLCK